MDYVKSVFFEYVVVVRVIREVNFVICKKIMQIFRREIEGFLRVLFEEVGVVVYDNFRFIVIKGEMEGLYMVVFSESCGFVYLDMVEMDCLGKIKFSVFEDDLMVVIVKCIKVMLEDRIFVMVQIILENQDI